MSIAKRAVKLDSGYLQIEILDTEDGITRYRRGKQVAHESELDLAVDHWRPDEIALVTKADGTPHLQQQAKGLPKKIVLAFVNWPQPPIPEIAAPGIVGNWQPEIRFEYEQEDG